MKAYTILQLIKEIEHAKSLHEKCHKIQFYRKKKGKKIMPHIGMTRWHKRWINTYDANLIALKMLPLDMIIRI
jgi:hypothetical protein